jgi:hypothetical protein
MNIVDKLKLPPNTDGRVHLADWQRQDIIKRHRQGEGIRSIARIYKKICSRRLIQFVIFPERKQKLYAERTKNKVWLKYYDKEKHSQAVKNLRAKKRKLYNIPKFNHPSEFKKHSDYKRIKNLTN